jgi:hypothetical protein
MSAPVDLLPHERILWEGHPVRRRLWRRSDVFYVPFSVVWTGGVASVVVVLVARGAGPGLIGPVVLLLFGLHITFGRFVVRAVSWRRTRYVITDRRVLVVGGLSGRWTRSQYLHALPPPVMAERPDRSGSLAFGAFPGFWDSDRRRSPWASEPGHTPVLWDVAEVRHVRDVVAWGQAAANPTG